MCSRSGQIHPSSSALHSHNSSSVNSSRDLPLGCSLDADFRHQCVNCNSENTKQHAATFHNCAPGVLRACRLERSLDLRGALHCHGPDQPAQLPPLIQRFCRCISCVALLHFPMSSTLYITPYKLVSTPIIRDCTANVIVRRLSSWHRIKKLFRTGCLCVWGGNDYETFRRKGNMKSLKWKMQN